MKKLLLPFFIFLFSMQGFSQLLSWSPQFPTEGTTPFVITMDASKGNKALYFYTPSNGVYVHIGVITNKSTNSADWRYSKFEWGTSDAAANATYTGNGSFISTWAYTINGGLRSYFGITDATETIQKIAILFRNADGSKAQRNSDGSDMYVPIYTSALAVKITTPFFQPKYNPVPEIFTKNIGDNVTVAAKSSAAATLKLYLNGDVIQTATAATSITATPTLTEVGNQQVIAEASNGGVYSRDTLNFYVPSPISIAPLPAGVKQGINYNANNTSATLVLYAPFKSRISVIGDFSGSNWIEQSQYQMNKTPDGNYWWLTINGLAPGTEYSYQYLIDGTLKIAGPYAEKILDPWNDKYITEATYPGLKPYPTGATSGIVSVLQTAKPVYNWDVDNFQRPDKRNLVIYELLVRDFIANHDWNTLRDTLSYLKRLGINAIEIMPLNEFEGNESWGYNPDFYFAPDKYYGPAATLKEFIDSCHKSGIAVIMDIALNHSFGQSPMVQMYWDANNSQPASNNPWYNSVPKHPFNVGYDMNHESQATRYFVSRVVTHWLQDFKIDGFRFDLSKGFTQNNTAGDVGAWGAYDASRIAIWKQYYDTLQLKSPDSYCILEHFADNSEEQVLSNYGMMLWGNENHNYSQASMGWSDDADFSWGFANVRDWTNPYLVTYMESHDEERVMYRNINFGNAVPGYNIKDTITALKRQELTAAFFFTIPGPKMIWQFGEIGYDYSINYCPDGTIGDCRVDNKPIKWDYLQQAGRKELFDVYSHLIRLRTNPLFKETFTTNVTEQSLGGYFKWIKLGSTASKLVVVGNFDVAPQTGSVTFPSTGTWYDYLNGTTINVSSATQSFTLQPGEYHVFTSVEVALPVTLMSFSGSKEGDNNVLAWEVADEENLAYYELQKSDDGQHFSTLARIDATEKSHYIFTDEAQQLLPIIYYRLKSVDKDGHFSYSTIVKIRRGVKGWHAQVNPNPFINNLKVDIESPIKDKAALIITDMNGRALYKQNISIMPGANSYEISETGKLSQGTYLLTILSPYQNQNIKVVKKK